MAELLQCPFCGGTADSWLMPYGDERVVMCDKCRAKTAYYKTDDEAENAWNKRAREPYTMSVYRLMEICEADIEGRLKILPKKELVGLMGKETDGASRMKLIDAVSVVRCKNCEHYNITGCSDGFGWCEDMDRGVFDEHYCSRGERREKE